MSQAFWTDLVDDPVQIVIALSAVLAAVFTWRAAVHAANAAKASERWAFLSQSPIVVPWIDHGTSIKVKNRGGGSAHHLEWLLKADGGEVARGDSDDVLNAGGSRPLVGIPGSMKLADQIVEIVCTYSSSWGDDYMLTRTYPRGGKSRIRLEDAEGNVVSKSRRRL